MIKDSGNRREFQTGAVRDMAEGKGRMDLLPHSAIIEISKHCENGAKKYGEYNWQRGIPTHCYIDSAVRHYLKYLRGDADEPHDRAFVWNIICCIWTCKNEPNLNDYRKDNVNEGTGTVERH